PAVFTAVGCNRNGVCDLEGGYANALPKAGYRQVDRPPPFLRPYKPLEFSGERNVRKRSEAEVVNVAGVFFAPHMERNLGSPDVARIFDHLLHAEPSVRVDVLYEMA